MKKMLIQIVQREWAYFCIIPHSQNYFSEYLVKLKGAKMTPLDFSWQRKIKLLIKALLQVSVKAKRSIVQKSTCPHFVIQNRRKLD